MAKYISSHTGTQIDNGVDKALNPDSVPQAGSSSLITSDAVSKVQQGFAPIETSSTSAHAYAVDDLLVYNGVLYKAKTAISVGNTLTVGTNIEQTTIANKLNNVDTQITANTDTTLTGLLKGNGSKVSAETRYVPTVSMTKAQYEALNPPAADTMYIITDDDSGVDDLAAKSNLASIKATGSTNTTGSIIPSGTYFYLNGVLVLATSNIGNGATFTSGTNYSVVSVGALNELKSALDNKNKWTDIPAGTTKSISATPMSLICIARNAASVSALYVMDSTGTLILLSGSVSGFTISASSYTVTITNNQTITISVTVFNSQGL